MSAWASVVRIAARVILFAYALAILVFTSASVALIAKHYGADDFKQGAAFAFTCFFLLPFVSWLAEKADL